MKVLQQWFEQTLKAQIGVKKEKDEPVNKNESSQRKRRDGKNFRSGQKQ